MESLLNNRDRLFREIPIKLVDDNCCDGGYKGDAAAAAAAAGDDVWLLSLCTDHIAVPGRSGAMENWGLITYSETYLMYNSSTDYLYNGRSVAAVIGHELAHFVSTLMPTLIFRQHWKIIIITGTKVDRGMSGVT